MDNIVSQRIKQTPPSFIRGILKAAESDDVISFAGGLPNPISFPQEALKESMDRVVTDYGSRVFQYATTAGLLGLREYIAQKYQKQYHLDVQPDDIIITTGSQQALDLIGKVLINEGDSIAIEEPGYLGAIQAFSQYQPKFHGVPLLEEGLDIGRLEEILKAGNVKFAYVVPNFQNPTGLTYSEEKRKAVLELVRKYHCILVEDDPYGELSFDGQIRGYISKDGLKESILLGTFSKTVTPGMRLGFMIIKDEKLRKYINTAKEAADLHSNIFAQYCLWDYVIHNELQEHIQKIRYLYKEQCETMIKAMENYFPTDVAFTRPEGGMFIWATLPEGISSKALFDKAIQEKVAFVPGDPFYTDGRNANTMRLNYTNASREVIEEGIQRLGKLF